MAQGCCSVTLEGYARRQALQPTPDMAARTWPEWNGMERIPFGERESPEGTP
jgi:hypothetical protein